jgi:choline kinase
MKAVVLAAGVGSRLRPHTDSTPKALLPVAGRPILDRALEAFGSAGIDEVIVVTGHLAGAIDAHLSHTGFKVRTIFNPRYATSNNYFSLLVAQDALEGAAFIKVDADLLFAPEVLDRLLAASGDLALGLDRSVKLGAEQMKILLGTDVKVIAVSKLLAPDCCAGESIGIEKVNAAFAPVLFEELRRIEHEGATNAYYEDAYDRLARREDVDIRGVDVTGLPWAEIDDEQDWRAAHTLFSSA